VINPNGVVVATGGEIADSETTTICTTTVGVSEAPEENLRVYPNPANDFLFIQTESSAFEIRLYDSVGRMVLNQFNSASQANLPTSNLSEGVYTLTVVSEKGTYNTQVVINH